jgi:hypothetical protein
MISEFLGKYQSAISLEEKRFNVFFPVELRRADHLLFSEEVICEEKKIRNFDAARRVELIRRKGSLTQQGFKRAMYSTINNALREAGKQIRDTRKALDLPNALGLVILENFVPADLSFMTLIDAAERKMRTGLTAVDCVLCSDCVNVFRDPEGKPITGAQTVSRATTRAKRLSDLVQGLMSDWCAYKKVPFLPGRTLAGGDQRWIVDNDGRFQRYDAKFEFEVDNSG